MTTTYTVMADIQLKPGDGNFYHRGDQVTDDAMTAAYGSGYTTRMIANSSVAASTAAAAVKAIADRAAADAAVTAAAARG